MFDEAVNDGASFVFNLWCEEEENDGDTIH